MILSKENKILREKAKAVENPRSPEIKKIVAKMAEAMFNEPDGVGIAAPQIGESLQVFLVAKDFLDPMASVKSKSDKRKKDFMVFMNPSVKKFSQKKANDIEGCLSVRGVYGEVARSEKLNIEYTDENGKKHARGASGLLARVIQHEVDHLNGVLFIDKAKNLKHIT